MLPRKHRLTESRDFRRLQSRGKRRAGRFVALRALAMGDRPSRFGVSVSERVGGAVVRNRVKRRLREAVRLTLPEAARGWDFVLNAREGAASASFEELADEVKGGIESFVRSGGTRNGA